MSGEGETRGRWGAGKSPLGGPSVGTGSGLGASLSYSQALCPGRLPGQEREDEVSLIEGLPLIFTKLLQVQREAAEPMVQRALGLSMVVSMKLPSQDLK